MTLKLVRIHYCFKYLFLFFIMNSLYNYTIYKSYLIYFLSFFFSRVIIFSFIQHNDRSIFSYFSESSLISYVGSRAIAKICRRISYVRIKIGMRRRDRDRNKNKYWTIQRWEQWTGKVNFNQTKSGRSTAALYCSLPSPGCRSFSSPRTTRFYAIQSIPSHRLSPSNT